MSALTFSHHSNNRIMHFVQTYPLVLISSVSTTTATAFAVVGTVHSSPVVVAVAGTVLSLVMLGTDITNRDSNHS